MKAGELEPWTLCRGFPRGPFPAPGPPSAPTMLVKLHQSPYTTRTNYLVDIKGRKRKGYVDFSMHTLLVASLSDALRVFYHHCRAWYIEFNSITPRELSQTQFSIVSYFFFTKSFACVCSLKRMPTRPPHSVRHHAQKKENSRAWYIEFS